MNELSPYDCSCSSRKAALLREFCVPAACGLDDMDAMLAPMVAGSTISPMRLRNCTKEERERVCVCVCVCGGGT